VSIEHHGEDGSPILGFLESPAAKSVTADVVAVAGWAFSVAGPITGVDVSVDGLPMGHLQYGIARKDIRAVHPDAPEACGYRGETVFALPTVGQATLVAHVTDACGNARDFAQSILVRPQVARMRVDSPRSGEVTEGRLAIWGWAFSLRAPIARIEVSLDNQLIGEVPHGFPRDDVLGLFHHPVAERCGFAGDLTFAPVRMGDATITVRATDLLGHRIEADVPIRLTSGEPSGEIEQVKWRGGTLEVAGWGLLPIHTGPCIARLFVDDRPIGQARLHLSRPDIQRRFPANPQAGRSGFRLRTPFVSPDDGGTDPLVLSVEFADDHGRQLRRHTHLLRDARTQRPGDMRAIDRVKGAIATFGDRYGRDPSILDWHTDLDLAHALPEDVVFSPPFPADAPSLPYLDRSVDLVVVPSSQPPYLAEARRVAAAAIIRPPARAGDGGAAHGGPPIVEWRDDADATAATATCSIIIAVHNNARYTRGCLSRVSATLPDNFAGEIIVVDDASSDDTAQILLRQSQVDGRLRVLRRTERAGFVHNCNWGATEAIGEVLVFLNNDTLPEGDWLRPLLRVLRDCPRVGAVGGKLLYPDRTLQEAGCVIFSDGSGWNFGRHDEAIDYPLYNYLREVDYCSGALLATRRALFTQAGGFDLRYAPAYYEDVDYCFQLRAMGYAVYYQPESVVVHFEGASSGTDVTRGVKRYQAVNRSIFIDKWRETLRRYPSAPDRYDRPSLYGVAVRDEAAHGVGGHR